MKTLSEMVREAGLPEAWISKNGVLSWEQLKRFSKLVRADERARMAEQPAQQEPVAWLHPANATCVTTDPSAYVRGVPLYTTPQPAQRKPLTDEEILTYKHMIDWTAEWSYINFARAIEAAHGIKENT